MNFKKDELAPAGSYTYSKCPTFRNTYPVEETSFTDRNRSNYLFQDHIKGDDGANYPHVQREYPALPPRRNEPAAYLPVHQEDPSSFSYPYDPRVESVVHMADPEIVIDERVFQKMSLLHKRDGLFLQRIGVLHIKE